jgi:hypothetical protein
MLVGGLVVLALVAAGIVAEIEPTGKKGAWTAAVRAKYIANCQKEAESSPSLCHCALASVEANYSVAGLEAIEAEAKRGTPPTRYSRFILECSAPKGKWTRRAEKIYISRCSEGANDLASKCRCIVRKAQITYSAIELFAAEAKHDPRYERRNKKWIAECLRH